MAGFNLQQQGGNHDSLLSQIYQENVTDRLQEVLLYPSKAASMHTRKACLKSLTSPFKPVEKGALCM